MFIVLFQMQVETIGDAYMVASGLPIRNGDLHAREVSCVALALINAAKNIKGIGHRSEESVQLRVGVHTGKNCKTYPQKATPENFIFALLKLKQSLEAQGKLCP